MKEYILIFVLFALFVRCSQTNNTKLYSSPPILILTSESGFGEYTAEILKAEGFNAYQMEHFSNATTLDYLMKFDMVILTEMPLTEHYVKIFGNYVQKGGNLIAFKPDTSISNVFGLVDPEGTVSDGYVAIDVNFETGKGLSDQTLQFHGVADKYKLKGAQKIADLFINENTTSESPAVVINKFGKGQAVAFTYNLPKNIVYTRQGNPEFAGIEKDGIFGIRGMDLFTDGWIDKSKNTINQADQHMHVLSRCIEYLSAKTKPLPRFWYFPDSLKCIAVLDNDGEDNNESDFEPQFRDIDSMGAKMTIYLKDIDKVSKEWVDKWVDKGFEIAAHPDNTEEAENPTWNRMDSVIGDIKKQISLKYGLNIQTNVNHWFVWVGRNADGTQNFAAQARLEEKHGIEMDGNLAHYDINSNQGENYLGPLGIKQGNFNGSGLVMKFADVKGKTVNVYQRFNAVYDQQYMDSNDPEGFFYCFKGLVDRSLNADIYSMISIKAHNSMYHFSKEPLMKMLDYANTKDIPVWTALNLLNFLKMKDEASFTNFTWSNNSLSFTLNSSIKHKNGLTFMLPATYGDKKISRITKNDEETVFSIRTVKDLEYAFVTVQGGSNYEFIVKYI